MKCGKVYCGELCAECAGEENDENVKVNSVATSCEDLMNMPQTDASTNTEKQKQGEQWKMAKQFFYLLLHLHLQRICW